MSKEIISYSLIVDTEGRPIEEPREMYKGEYVSIEKTRNVRTPKQVRMYENKSKIKSFNEDNGGFVAMYYVKNELLFNELELDLASISRIIYLATYLDYDGKLVMNGGISSGKAKTSMTRKEMQIVLGLSEATFNFYCCINENFIYISSI